jgi:hypothetical protein
VNHAFTAAGNSYLLNWNGSDNYRCKALTGSAAGNPPMLASEVELKPDTMILCGDSPTLDPNHHYIFADEWPKLTFGKFEPMSKAWILGRTPFMTAHNQRPTYELEKNCGAGSGFAMKLGPASTTAAYNPRISSSRATTARRCAATCAPSPTLARTWRC